MKKSNLNDQIIRNADLVVLSEKEINKIEGGGWLTSFIGGAFSRFGGWVVSLFNGDKEITYN